MDAKKEDTRRKIELGGLILKSGLSSESKAVVLGALILAEKALSGADSDKVRARFIAAGNAAFMDEKS